MIYANSSHVSLVLKVKAAIVTIYKWCAAVLKQENIVSDWFNMKLTVVCIPYTA